jgi:cob(I)alamin adenosyltransferase
MTIKSPQSFDELIAEQQINDMMPMIEMQIMQIGLVLFKEPDMITQDQIDKLQSLLDQKTTIQEYQSRRSFKQQLAKQIMINRLSQEA